MAINVSDVYRRLGDMHTTQKKILAELERLNGSNSNKKSDIVLGSRERKPK